MYDSPIKVYEQIPNIISEFNNQKDKLVCEAVAKIGVDVDKYELLKALQYDREQYSKGYSDGKLDGAKEFAEWLCRKSDYTDIDINGFTTCRCGASPKDTTIEQALAEWQKEVNNAE